MLRPLSGLAILVAALSGFALPALAGIPFDNGFEWATIEDTDNPPWPGSTPVPGEEPTGRGAVNYAYRIMKTEVTGGQWFEFVMAYAPFIDPEFQASVRFTSSLITFIGPGANGIPQYALNSGGDDLPANMSWRFAARFCNWLHNGKVNERWAFESGVYDTSTFGDITHNGLTFRTDQARHSVGARYWIPTMDEWMKAVYWDPNKTGPKEGGWWEHPNSSNQQLFSGPPGVGQTSAGSPSIPMPPVGSYPEVQTPWGLLDVSGTRTEWLEDYVGGIPILRRVNGSAVGSEYYWYYDHVSIVAADPPTGSNNALRLASMAPFVIASPDVNQDGFVDGLDIAMLLSQWGPCDEAARDECQGDVTHDLMVDGSDLIMVLSNWSSTFKEIQR